MILLTDFLLCVMELLKFEFNVMIYNAASRSKPAESGKNDDDSASASKPAEVGKYEDIKARVERIREQRLLPTHAPKCKKPKVSCNESFMLHVVNSKTSKVDNLLKLNITFDRAFQHVHCFIYNWIFSMFNNLLSRLLCPGSASG